MKARDLAELAARNLREAILRNTLTTLGIAVGVASLVAMLSLGVGLQELASKRLARSGLFDTVFVTSRQTFRGMGRAPATPPAAREETRALDEAARQRIAQLANVVEVYPEIRFPAEVRYSGAAHFTMVSSLPPSARSRDAFEGIQGSFFTAPQADEAILQVEFARELASQPATLLGQDLLLHYFEREARDPAAGAAAHPVADGAVTGPGFSVVPRERKLRIVGIIETQPAPGAGGFGIGRMFIPLQFAESLKVIQGTDLRDIARASSANPSYLTLSVRVDNPKHVQGVEGAIKQMGFSAFSLLDATRSFQRFFAILDMFLGIFGSLALAVASLGIVNTLVMAILERRREIGILKALGAGNRDIRQLFFAEAGVMGLVGGALGVLLGWGIGRIIHFGTTLYLKSQGIPAENVWSVPWWLVTGAVAFAVAVSLVSGIYPAGRAARLDPAQALRYE